MTSLLPIVASATAEVMDTVFDTSEDSVAAKKRKTCNFDCSSTTFSGPGQNEIFLCRVEESEVKKFEENRNRILESYPEDHKAMFNELGFGKYQGKQYPAMIVNPFSVVPGDVRKNWAAKYVKAGLINGTSCVGYLVWWIGTPTEDGMGEYSVVTTYNFTSYEKADAKWKKLPDKVIKMIKTGKQLSARLEEEKNSLVTLTELYHSPKEERTHPRALQVKEEDFWKHARCAGLCWPFSYPNEVPEEKSRRKLTPQPAAYEPGALRQAVLLEDVLHVEYLLNFCTTKEMIDDQEHGHNRMTAFMWAACGRSMKAARYGARCVKSRDLAKARAILLMLWNKYLCLCNEQELKDVLINKCGDREKRIVLFFTSEGDCRETLELVLSFYDQVFQNDLTFLGVFLDRGYVDSNVMDILDKRIFKSYEAKASRQRQLRSRYRAVVDNATRANNQGANSNNEVTTMENLVDARSGAGNVSDHSEDVRVNEARVLNFTGRHEAAGELNASHHSVGEPDFVGSTVDGPEIVESQSTAEEEQAVMSPAQITEHMGMLCDLLGDSIRSTENDYKAARNLISNLRVIVTHEVPAELIRSQLAAIEESLHGSPNWKYQQSLIKAISVVVET